MSTTTFVLVVSIEESEEVSTTVGSLVVFPSVSSPSSCFLFVSIAGGGEKILFIDDLVETPLLADTFDRTDEMEVFDLVLLSKLSFIVFFIAPSITFESNISWIRLNNVEPFTAYYNYSDNFFQENQMLSYLENCIC